MKARYVVIGSIMLVFCGILFAGMQEVNAAFDRGHDGTEPQDINTRTPEQAANYGMGQEITGWSQLVEIAAFAGGAVSVGVLGYGIVSTDSTYSAARARI